MERKPAQKRAGSWPTARTTWMQIWAWTGQMLEDVTSFKYLGATLCKDGTCSAEVRIKIASAMAAMDRQNRIWRCKQVSGHIHPPVKHGPCLLTLKKGSRFSNTSAWGNFSVSPTSSTRPRTGCGARSSSLCVHRNLFWYLSRNGNLQGLAMSHATTPSGQLGGWATPWSAEKILDGQHQRVDIPARARNARKGLLQKRLEEDLCWIVPPVPLTTKLVK